MEKQTRNVAGLAQWAAVWATLAIGVLVLLIQLVRLRFAPETFSGIDWSMATLALALIVAGIGFLLAYAHNSGDPAHGATASSDLHQHVRDLLHRVEHLPDDADAAREEINEIGAMYNVLAERLAQQGTVFPNHLEVQMALGDVMVATQRVWTTLADNAPQHAAAAWHAACAHARRVHALMA